MPLSFRPAQAADYARLESLTLESFEPITWAKRVDERFGPLNGVDWRQRWQDRFRRIFESQRVLVAEQDGEIAAFASGTIDESTRLGYIDLLAVDRRRQGSGLGREMLRAMLRYLKEQGAEHAHLECLADNEAGNRLYRSEGFEEVARSIRWFVRIP